MADGRIERAAGVSSATSTEQKKHADYLAKRNKVELEYAKKLNKELADLNEKEKKKLNKKLEDIDKQHNKKTLEEKKKQYQEEYDLAVTTQDKIKANAKATASIIGETLKKSFSVQGVVDSAKRVIGAAGSGVEQFLGSYSSYMSGIEARLQGSAKSFADISGTISGAIGASPYVRQTAVLEKLNQLVSEGIAYNVEQRAFLGTISDKIATTFDAANGTLLQLIRLQQADTTAARLGLEASLTTYFNKMFGDTSYLSNTFDAVSQILLESSSQMGYQQSVEFEYAVQKWLGSLGGVGVSQSTLTALAQGLSYLGTGNVSGLASNEALQRLFVKASGGGFGSILTGGLTAESANQILTNIVSFAQSIGSIDNNVIRQQYASLFGFSLSDIVGIMKLTSSDILDISNNLLSYGEMYAETERQLTQVGSRMSIKERLDNVMNNVMASMGETIGSSAGLYGTWLLADMLEKAGDIPIPTIMAMGTGIDLNTTVSGIMKTALMGGSLLAQLGTIVGSIFGPGLSLENWGAQDVRTRGQGSALRTTGISRGLSQTTYIGNIETGSLYEGALADAESTYGYSANQAEQQSKEDEKLEILRDSIAKDLTNIYNLLSTGAIRVIVDPISGIIL